MYLFLAVSKCADGWIQNPFRDTCVKLFMESLSYGAAQSRCSDHNGWLVILDSEDSRLWMKTLRNNNEGEDEKERNSLINKNCKTISCQFFVKKVAHLFSNNCSWELSNDTSPRLKELLSFNKIDSFFAKILEESLEIIRSNPVGKISWILR